MLHISEAHLLLEDFRSSQRSLCRASPSYSHPSPPCQLYPSSPAEVTTPHDALLLCFLPVLCRGHPPAVVCRRPASVNLFISALHHLCQRVPGLFMWRRFTAAAALFLLWRVPVSSLCTFQCDVSEPGLHRCHRNHEGFVYWLCVCPCVWLSTCCV